jgi:hypothetical protein
MTKGEIVGNVIVVKFKDMRSPQYFQYKYYKPTNFQDEDYKMKIVESIIFGQFGYPIFEGILTLHT